MVSALDFESRGLGTTGDYVIVLCHGLDISLYVFRSSHECKWSGAAFGGLAHYGGVAVFLVTSFFRNWDILLRC